MTNIDQDALEELLRHASPRPAPSQEDEAAVRAAVRAEWRDLTGKRHSRQRIVQYAIAATVLIGAFLAFSTLRTTAVPAVQLATIEKSIRPVYLLGEQAELRETHDLSIIYSGQTIITGDGAGLALAWGSGGSVRIDENSRVRFDDEDSVYLEDGQVYFDSRPVSLVADANGGEAPELTLTTDFGEIRHIGTQFMVEVDPDELTVSVREGEVSIDGTFHDRLVQSGEQATFAGSQQPSVLSISRSGEVWDWVNRITPPIDVEGRSAFEFLTWASREMGLDLEFVGDAEADAQRAILGGTVDRELAVELRARLASAALESRIDEGVLRVYRHR